MYPLLIAVRLILLHGPGAQAIELNVDQITSIAEPREGKFHEGVKCLLHMVNGKFIGVVEECREVVRKIEESE
jgi:hypothetical protein